MYKRFNYKFTKEWVASNKEYQVILESLQSSFIKTIILQYNKQQLVRFYQAVISNSF